MFLLGLVATNTVRSQWGSNLQDQYNQRETVDQSPSSEEPSDGTHGCLVTSIEWAWGCLSAGGTPPPKKIGKNIVNIYKGFWNMVWFLPIQSFLKQYHYQNKRGVWRYLILRHTHMTIWDWAPPTKHTPTRPQRYKPLKHRPSWCDKHM